MGYLQYCHLHFLHLAVQLTIIQKINIKLSLTVKMAKTFWWESIIFPDGGSRYRINGIAIEILTTWNRVVTGDRISRNAFPSLVASIHRRQWIRKLKLLQITAWISSLSSGIITNPEKRESQTEDSPKMA